MVMIPFFRKGSLTIWLSLSGEMWLYLGFVGFRFEAYGLRSWALGFMLKVRF